MNDYRHMIEYLMHHGIKGQKWGVRRFQNEDGSLTLAGEERYLKGDNRANQKGDERFKNAYKYIDNMTRMNNKHNRESNNILKSYREAADAWNEKPNAKNGKNMDKYSNDLLIASGKHAKEKKEFVQRFEQENNVKVVNFQDVKDAQALTYTDGKKYYILYKGKNRDGTTYFNFSDISSDAKNVLRYANMKWQQEEWDRQIKDGKTLLDDLLDDLD